MHLRCFFAIVALRAGRCKYFCGEAQKSIYKLYKIRYTLQAVFYFRVGYAPEPRQDRVGEKHGNGFFQRVFYDEDIKLPLALIAGSEFLYGMVIYVLLFMLKSDFHFLNYLRHVIMPELVYTILVTLVLYQIILHINRRLEEEEKRSASRFV